MTCTATATSAARAGLRSVSMAVDRIRRPPPGVTVLIYHRVGGASGSAVDLPLAQFRDQVEWLAASSSVVTLDEAAIMLRSGAARPAVVISFDDGTTDWTGAMGVLEAAGLPATFFVATRFVDEGLEFPGGGAPISWNGLGDMVATGLATIGSHTHTHRLLHDTDRHETIEELDRSKGLIEEKLGTGCRHFAYPKAMPPGAVAASLVAERFSTAALAGSGPNPYGRSDLLRLRRTPIQTADDMAVFEAKARGGFRLEGSARDVAVRVRFRSARS